MWRCSSATTPRRDPGRRPRSHYSGRLLYEVRLNGEPVTEAELNAAFAGTFGVAVGLITGDDKACAQVAKRLPGSAPRW